MAEHSELLARLRAVKPPPAVLDRERERRLTTRQREILDHLGEMFDDGFAGLTMATIAARSNCSLRTLYGLAPSRDELVLIVVDRNLWRVGRGAKEMITPQMEPLEALQAYLEAANEAVDGMTVPFARDLASMPAAQRQWELHAGYLVEIARCLLDLAVQRGEIPEVDTAAVARVMAGLGVELSRPAVMPTLQTSPKQAAGSIVSLMILGLRASRTAAATAVPTRQAPRRKGAA
jgi:AcrR family transcriptional regulator